MEMTGDDAMVISSGDDHEEVVPPSLRLIAGAAFYGQCKAHPFEECNLYCGVCQAYKFGKHASFQLDDLASGWDVSDICRYFFNNRFVAFVHKRGDRIARSHGQSDPRKCKSCEHRFNRRRQLPDTMFKYCSVACKVQAVTKSFRIRPKKQENPQRAPFY
ncbi:uncharacterized protein LOC120291866 [Eucalyptus grandis]|uniref:uncharacterized protein LOC120291866 n=1 Tax=Eucalyptus grandis TaxID=71139 RepID=UPI00192EEAEF|nr:uncharacterized protein LOC120291866 [Eucalyptus grandis]